MTEKAAWVPRCAEGQRSFCGCEPGKECRVADWARAARAEEALKLLAAALDAWAPWIQDPDEEIDSCNFTSWFFSEFVPDAQRIVGKRDG